MNERIGKGRTAVSYLRVSGKGQIDGDGFPRQRAAIEAYAKANNIEVVAEFRDEGVSGTKELDDRDGLAEIVARIKEGDVGLVLVENASRLARDLLVGVMRCSASLRSLLGENRRGSSSPYSCARK